MKTMEFENPVKALEYAKVNNKQVERNYKIKVNSKTGICYREYYYIIK